ncbi:ankyrin repeat-containing domain protein [Stachybotrys elegans]|uniref:Ankyrin repeat-containing domain protein n=1 Tax=Stachybotrys elegans TaxID=80388 RepID=A0A8K0SLL6_9HYPO|nr:ankyrin repeat-containing domain protein [Stachybotrys elegans]
MPPSATAQSVPSETYWEAAYRSLDDGLRATLSSTDKNDVLAALLKTAAQKRGLCLLKQLKFKLPNGDVIILRDIIEKICKWVNTFIAIGDVAVQYNPSAAAIPWAAVRFILQAAINDIHIEGTMVADLEIVSRLIARYSEFERIHLAHKSSVKQQLEAALTRMYASILVFLAEAIKYFDTSSFVRVVKNTFKTLDNRPAQDIIQQESELLKIAGLSDMERLHYLEDHTSRIIEQTSRILKEVDDAKYLKMLGWLSQSPFTRHHEAVSETRMPGSGSWLLHHPEYKSWQNSSASSIMLLHGIPGSGKSKICSAVVDDYLTQSLNNPLAAPLAYFYCAKCEYEPDRTQPDNIVRSILRQLTFTNSPRPKVRDIIASEFERRVAQAKVDGIDLRKLPIDSCVNFILELTVTDPVIIVVDALDEISEYHRPSLIHALEQIVVKSSSVVKVFLTSRNDSQIFSLLHKEIGIVSNFATQQAKNCYIKSIEISPAGTLLDMKNYVDLVLSQAVRDRRLLRRDPSSELAELLKERLVSGAGEMFQWVNIQLEYLCQLHREEDIEAALQSRSMPTLHSAYREVLERILSKENPSRSIVIRTLSWLLYMREAMTPNEFLAAVFAQASKEHFGKNSNELAALCSGLILLDSKCNTFRFSHYSVQEFISAQDVFSPSSSQQILALDCLKICRNGPSFSTSPDTQDALYRYAAIFWGYHCHRAASLSEDVVAGEVISFVYDSPGEISLSFMGWLDQISSVSKDLANEHEMKRVSAAISNPQSSPIFAASAYGIDYLLHHVRIDGEPFDWDQRNEQGHTSLYLACAFGHQQAVHILLTYGADPNITCGRFGNPLQAACFNGHTAVVSILLEHGASVRLEGTFSNALEACFRGYCEDCAMALYEKGDAIRTTEEFHFALEGAAQAGFTTLVDALLQSKWTSNSGFDEVDKMKTRVARAIKGGQTGILRLFLNNRPDPLSLLPEGSMSTAAIYGHERVLDLLSQIGASHEENSIFGSPLRCAALMGREQIVRKLLFEYGANVNGIGPFGTALHAACGSGHYRIVRLLLRSGADFAKTARPFGTPLQAAAYRGHRDVVELLANSEISEESLRNAINSAIEGGNVDIVNFLINQKRREPEMHIGPPDVAPNALSNPAARLCSFASGRRHLDKNDQYLFRPSLLGLHQAEKESDPSVHEETTRKEKCQDTSMVLRTKLSNLEESRSCSYDEILSIIEAIDHSESYMFAGSFGELGGSFVARYPEDHLRVAIRKGDLEIVQLILPKTSPDRGALMEAARHGQFGIFRFLFEARRPLFSTNEVVDALCNTPKDMLCDFLEFSIKHMHPQAWTENRISRLLRSACQANLTAVEQLVPFLNGAEPESRAEALEAGIVHAKEAGREEILCFLLSKLSLISKPRAFKAACDVGHTSMASSLLQGADDLIDKSAIKKGINTSASYGHSDLLSYLIDTLPLDERLQLGPQLRAASGNGHISTVNTLLLQGKQRWQAFVSDANRALIEASLYGHTDCVQALLTAGADPNAVWHYVPWKEIEHQRHTPSLAQHKDHIPWDTIQFPRQRTTALWETLSCLGIEKPTSRHERTLQVLLEHGADSNSLREDGKPPIIHAAEFCSERIVSLLIGAGADINTVYERQNAVMMAVQRERYGAGVLQVLMEAGAVLECYLYSGDYLWDCCLRWFRGTGEWQTTRTLVEAMEKGPGAVAKILAQELPSVKARHGGIPGLLQSAVAVRDMGFVELLVAKGVDVNCTGSCFTDALGAARHFGYLDIAARLVELGAETCTFIIVPP